MKRKIKFIIFGAIFLIISISCFKIYTHWAMKDFFKAGQTTNVRLSDWTKLEKGMTKDQVSLLGDASIKESLGNKELPFPEMWQYNYQKFTFLGKPKAHDKAYVVYFDNNELLSYWREPIDQNKENP